MNFAYIREQQQNDRNLLALQEKYPDKYVSLNIDENVDAIICFRRTPDDTNWKIALPESMVLETVTWFHHVLGHPGERRLMDTMKQRYHHPQLRRHIDNLNCQDFQKYKMTNREYGLLPEREVRMAPWEEVAVDMIGPWDIKVNGRIVQFKALTCIDTVTNLVELTRADSKFSNHISDKFTQ